MKEPTRVHEVELTGTNLPEMEAEARRQLASSFNGQEWELTGVYAELQMVSVSSNTQDEWIPAQWSAAFKGQTRS